MRTSSEPTSRSMENLKNVTGMFDPIPAPNVRTGLTTMLGKSENDLDDVLDDIGDEVAFHIFTTPALREKFIHIGEPTSRSAVLHGGTLSMTAGSPLDRIHSEFTALEEMSDRLRKKVS